MEDHQLNQNSNAAANNTPVRECFRRIAHGSAAATGSAWTFIVVLLIVIVWATTGPYFHYSDTWQLVINTGTSVITFLMVFLIQNTQNRDALEIHLKLNELIRSSKQANNVFIDLAQLSDAELEKMKEFISPDRFAKIMRRA
jgi:low affinity Fe/Cu permease